MTTKKGQTFAQAIVDDDPRRARLLALVTQFRLQPSAAAAMLRSVADELEAELHDPDRGE